MLGTSDLSYAWNFCTAADRCRFSDLLWNFSTHFMFVRKPPTKYMEIKCIRNILDLQYFNLWQIVSKCGKLTTACWSISVRSFPNVESLPLLAGASVSVRTALVPSKANALTQDSFNSVQFWRIRSTFGSVLSKAIKTPFGRKKKKKRKTLCNCNP